MDRWGRKNGDYRRQPYTACGRHWARAHGCKNHCSIARTTPCTTHRTDSRVIKSTLPKIRPPHPGMKAWRLEYPSKHPVHRLDITSEGFVGIDDRSIDLTLSLPIPDSLPKDRPLFAALAGKTIKASVEGTLDDPKLQLDASLKQTAADVAADFIRELRNKKNQTPPDESSEKSSWCSRTATVIIQLSNPKHEKPQKPEAFRRKSGERKETGSTQRIFCLPTFLMTRQPMRLSTP